MVNFTNENLTDAMVASFDGCPDPRLKNILTSLVRHAHAFVCVSAWNKDPVGGVIGEAELLDRSPIRTESQPKR